MPTQHVAKKYHRYKIELLIITDTQPKKVCQQKFLSSSPRAFQVVDLTFLLFKTILLVVAGHAWSWRFMFIIHSIAKLSHMHTFCYTVYTNLPEKSLKFCDEISHSTKAIEACLTSSYVYYLSSFFLLLLAACILEAHIYKHTCQVISPVVPPDIMLTDSFSVI